MNRNLKNAFWMGLLVLAVAGPLHAATQAQEVWGSYGGNGFFNWEFKESVAYGEGRERRDTERNRLFSSTPEVRTGIERIDLDKRWELDPRKKRYTEESISVAREKALKEAERSRQEWEARQKKAAKEKKRGEEPKIRIRSAETKTTGPGPAETINGFACRPYTVTTTIEYESLPDHKLAGRQTFYQKQWTSDAPLLAQYRRDLTAYLKSASVGELSKKEVQALQEAVKKEFEKNEKNASVKAWDSYWSALGKINGYPVRTLAGFTFAPTDADTRQPAAQTPAPQDDSLVQAGDFSGGVGGLVGGMASRWASKKVEKKVAQKMAEHPAWVDEMAKDVNGQMIGWGWMSEIKSVTRVDDSSGLFELPAGYKKVSSL